MGLRLQYRIKGKANLKDLQKVFICAAGKDLDQYFDILADDLFRAQPNISIWYPAEDEDTPDDEESYKSLLADMNLFVIPVTAVFLDEESRARNLEMVFAMEHGIPVLPILFGKVSKSRFSEVCGKLHVLDKYDPDPTSLPYEEKLKLFMDSVILKDETVEKIRQAFVAYIFLSYRKKDRKYAQEVMRLIHKDPFARDIAIWYDEYLTPGEDFNDAIRAAFMKSDLFALVVTPNLLEQANYVMRVEYPMANEEGKKIIPIMPVPTDNVELERCYPGIPEVVPADEKTQDYIDKLIREALTIDQDDSPEHKFIMGLAYLSGIDVETDHERALSLITDSAEADLDEALLKLVSMYENGQGVQRSYYHGAVWHERYVDLLERRIAEGDNSVDARSRLISEMNVKILKWHNIFRDDKAWHMCVKMGSLRNDNNTLQEKTALLENSLISAQICLNAKKTPSYYIIDPFTRRAGELLAEAVNEMNSAGETAKAEDFRKLYSALIDMLNAQSKREKKDWTDAVQRYKDCISELEKCILLEDKFFVKRIKHSLVICYGELADCLYHLNGDPFAEGGLAAEYAHKAITLADEYGDEGISFSEKDIMIPKFILIRGMIAENKLTDAEELLQSFIALCDKRREDEESVDSMLLLSQAHRLFAEIEKIKGDLAEEAGHLTADTLLLQKLSGIIGNHNVYLKEIEDFKRLTAISIQTGTGHKDYLDRLFGIGIWHYRNDKDYFRQLAALARQCDDYPMFQKITKQLMGMDKVDQ